MTTKPLEPPTRSEQRRLSRERRALREAKRKEKATNVHSESKVSQAVSQALPRVITIDDLDESQMLVYKGIHLWWNTMKGIGGVAKPLIFGGYSGCGKTTLLSIALPALENPDGSKPVVVYCAYTGKAANVLMQKGVAAQTIHSLIYDASADPVTQEVIFSLKMREDVPADLIVVDEASMVPDDMRDDLESLGIPLLYTGDHGQLPPVAGRGNIMENPRFKLEEVHRQALDSGIISVATAVRTRQRVPNGVYGVHGDAVKLGRRAINDTKLLAESDVVICFTNATRTMLNKRLREYKGFEGNYPQVGEKLICVKNNKLTSMFNGLVLTTTAVRLEVGFVVFDAVDDQGKRYLDLKAYSNYFEDEDHPKIYGQTMFDLFEFAYAITGHKSQGSQWDNVIVVEEAMTRQSVDLKRRWLYTTLTRAAKRLTWISKFG